MCIIVSTNLMGTEANIDVSIHVSSNTKRLLYIFKFFHVVLLFVFLLSDYWYDNWVKLGNAINMIFIIVNNTVWKHFLMKYTSLKKFNIIHGYPWISTNIMGICQNSISYVINTWWLSTVPNDLTQCQIRCTFATYRL